MEQDLHQHCNQSLKSPSGSKKQKSLLAFFASPSPSVKNAKGEGESESGKEQRKGQLISGQEQGESQLTSAQEQGKSQLTSAQEQSQLSNSSVQSQSENPFSAAPNQSPLQSKSPTLSSPTRLKTIRSPAKRVIDSDEEEEEPSIDLSAFSSSCKSPIFSPSSKSPMGKKITSPNSFTAKPSGKQEEKRYSWLESIRDKEGNPPEHQDYNPKTLYIPPAQWKLFTPFERQFWEIKSEHYDCLVFFKKGKFYELYESDADVSVREFDLKMTERVNMRMTGIPEASFDYWAAKFIAKGYKIAKVDQMESGIGKEMRERDEEAGQKEKIIRRSLSCILTAGTLVDSGLLSSDLATFCMSLKFIHCPGSGGNSPGKERTKICATFVDTSTGKFFVCEPLFEEENSTATLGQLETLLAQIRPREIVCERKGLSAKALKIIKSNAFNPLISYAPGAFWPSAQCLLEVNAKGYFSHLPEALSQADEDSISCFGGLLEYLCMLKLDSALMSFNSISTYKAREDATFLAMDGQTLLNLEIFQNSFDASEKGTLVELLDHCQTAFGKRLLRFWIAHPLCKPLEINSRLESVQAIHEDPSIASFLSMLLDKIPDLERILCRIHLKSCKLSDFVLCLEAFQRIVRTFQCESPEVKASLDPSSLLFQLLFVQFPLQIAASTIEEIVSSFDLATAKTEGLIIPFAGAAPEFDLVSQQIAQIQLELDSYLQEQRIKFKCASIRYKDLGKELFQLEIPAEFCKSIPSVEYVAMSKTKTVYRYWTPTIKALVKRWQEAQERKRSILANIYALFMDKFDAHNEGCWKQCTFILGQIDCLYSLAKAASSLARNSTVLCKPIVHEGPESGVSITDSTHPSVPNCIPNSVALGYQSTAPMILLTGPNMGGKSTMLRQVCIQVILAQLGCYCPASSLSLVPFTKIFTRIGANDNILAGQSTFMVELSETCRILHEADHNSLVILDELGRGTSTFDGYAIAHSTLHYLLLYKRTRGLFSTHYHHLSQQMAHYPSLGRKFMGFQLVQGAEAGKNEVIFLYQLTDGTCSESFGMNVARMAGIPAPLIQRAQNIASEFERLNILKGVGKNESAGALSLPIAHQWDQRYLQGEEGAKVSEESRQLILETLAAVKL